ncbi:group 1 truncated hemoglobin [Sneathiella sp.]|uniref:group I truncated hemoglobin n=1 Tax=Sneathiella sp. TaxID=1964365 RepID=UPI0035656ADE
MSASLYERLGGTEAIERIVEVLVNNHLKNPEIAKRFAEIDVAKSKRAAADFFIMGTGGPNNYTGGDMVAVHKGMNISRSEFMAVLDDAMDALEKNNIGQREKEEVLFILYSMKGDVTMQ